MCGPPHGMQYQQRELDSFVMSYIEVEIYLMKNKSVFRTDTVCAYSHYNYWKCLKCHVASICATSIFGFATDCDENEESSLPLTPKIL